MSNQTHTFKLVYVDGELANVCEPFRLVASVLLERPVSLLKPLPNPPHTLANLADAFGLGTRNRRRVFTTIITTPNFWLTQPTPQPVAAVPEGDVVFVVDRPPTQGQSVLMQTIKWLELHGFANQPTVWVGGIPIL